MVDTQKGGERPRFRQDLVAELIEDSGKRFVDVADPDSGHVFRFYEVEYSLACAMDGERDVTGIVRWAQEDLGLHTNPNEVRSVIGTLGELGFLEGAATAAARPAQPAQPVQPAAKAAAANRWDQPTAMGEADEYLGKGVVHASGAAAKSSPSEDVELGHAGGMKAAASDLPKAPDFELGAPGTVKPPPEKTVGTQEIPLGSPGRPPDVSVDLSADVSVRPDDVKEAVRQSQVIRAPSVPQELLDSVAPVVSDKEAPPAKVETKQAPKPVEAPKPAPEKRPERQAQRAKPVEPLPPPKAPNAPAPRVSPALLVLLVLVVLGAGAFAVWKLILQKSNDTDKQSTQQPAPPPPPPAPPPPPPVESEKLASEQPPAAELKAPGAGTLEMIAANDSDVKAGAVIAALVGHKPIETEIANLTKDVDKRQGEVAQAEKDRDAAEAAGNKPGVTAAEKKIDDRKKALDATQAKLAAKTADLAKLVVKAPSDGKVAAVAKANAKVTANDVVAKLTPPPVLVTTFKTTSQPVTADARVLLAVKGAEQKLSCKVVAVDNGTKIACPHDAAPEGTEVTFAGIDTSAPKEEIDMGEGSGSAAGSGSGSDKAEKTDKAPAKAPPPAPPPRPRPMPRPTPKPPTPAVDKNAGSAAAPADKPAGTDQPAGSAAP